MIGGSVMLGKESKRQFENFFYILKCQCIYRAEPKDFQEYCLLVDDYICSIYVAVYLYLNSI